MSVAVAEKIGQAAFPTRAGRGAACYRPCKSPVLECHEPPRGTASDTTAGAGRLYSTCIKQVAPQHLVAGGSATAALALGAGLRYA
jgi:hypothetical protein